MEKKNPSQHPSLSDIDPRCHPGSTTTSSYITGDIFVKIILFLLVIIVCVILYYTKIFDNLFLGEYTPKTVGGR
jgi:hypothetical protein